MSSRQIGHVHDEYFGSDNDWTGVNGECVLRESNKLTICDREAAPVGDESDDADDRDELFWKNRKRACRKQKVRTTIKNIMRKKARATTAAEIMSVCASVTCGPDGRSADR